MTPDIRLMVVDFELDGCRSARERRQRMGGWRDRFGRTPELAVTDLSDDSTPDRARLGFLAMSRSPVESQKILRAVEEWLARNGDAVITDIQVEAL